MIHIEHLTKRYGNSEILKDVNAVVNKGDIISIIGPSGTGKSTLLRCINMLEHPTSGKIIINGVDVTDPKSNISMIRKKVGMVFQSYNLFDHLSVIDNLMIGPIKLLGMSAADAEKRALLLLSQVGMLERVEAFPSELSGGQKQRVAIARTLSMNPDIVLLDEPTSALDPHSVSEVLSVIRDIAKNGITMMIVTHEMKFAKNVSNRIFYLDQGVIYEEGSPEQIFYNPQKELTRNFINRTHNFEYHISDHSFDNYGLISKVIAFCIHYGFKGSQIDRICHIVEETVNLCFLSESGNRNDIIRTDGGIDILISYSEERDLTDYYIYAPERLETIINNDADKERLSKSIIGGISQNYKESVQSGKIELYIKVGPYDASPYH